MLWLAECYERSGMSSSAWAEFVEAADAAAKRSDERKRVARERAAALEPSLSKVTLDVPAESDLPGLEVTRDGTPVGRPVWRNPLPVDPGAHVLVATAPGYKAWQTTVNVEPGEHGSVAVPPLQREPGSEPQGIPAPTPRSSAGSSGNDATTRQLTAPPWTLAPSTAGSRQRTWGLAAGGVGIVGIGVGTVFGFLAKSQLDASNADNHCFPNNSCDAVDRPPGTELSMRQRCRRSPLPRAYSSSGSRTLCCGSQRRKAWLGRGGHLLRRFPVSVIERRTASATKLCADLQHQINHGIDSITSAARPLLAAFAPFVAARCLRHSSCTRPSVRCKPILVSPASLPSDRSRSSLLSRARPSPLVVTRRLVRIRRAAVVRAPEADRAPETDLARDRGGVRGLKRI